MLSIILSGCLIAHPEQCRDFKIPVDFQMPTKYCGGAACCRAMVRGASAVGDQELEVPAVIVE